ncbi:hypothetical protein ACIBF5_32495 [Micromonospora sp. NPDC050417]|uniref:hypothetical protein n=1 Tax=Micromonospora sp. NPDC050417 TaxID=3364280 RepID=UPI00378B7528
MAITKEELLSRRPGEDDVPLPSGGTVRVRGLTRGEVKDISDGVNEGKNMEPYSLSLALVDPVLTEEEAAGMTTSGCFDDVQAITTRVNELSGIAQGSAKESYKSPGS